MVEGHAVHRLAAAHRANLVKRAFRADSPNGRFDAGASAIDGRVLARVEAVGKNLFHFYDARGAQRGQSGDTAVVHMHFGMSGQFRTAPGAVAPEPKPTTRLRLTEIVEGTDGKEGVVGLVSAQLLVHGGMDVYEEAKARLGQDPLREDADEAVFLERASKTSKSIGAVLMDQSFVAGVGNIYRAEICYKARVHPDEPSNLLTPDQLRLVWHHSVDLLQRGFVSGSILTTDGAAAKAGRRRYVYNQATCLCSARVKSWDIAQRRAYACLSCQPRIRAADGSVLAGPSSSGVNDVKVFPSRCAPDAPEQRFAAPAKMRVAELRKELESRGLDVSGGKPTLVARFAEALSGDRTSHEKAECAKAENEVAESIKTEDVKEEAVNGTDVKEEEVDGTDLRKHDVKRKAIKEEVIAAHVKSVASGAPEAVPRVGTSHLPVPASAIVAAAEKAAIGESRAVEHVADVSNQTDLATAAGKMKVTELRAKLRERNLDASGTKAVLAERLVADVIANGGSLSVVPMRPAVVKAGNVAKKVKFRGTRLPNPKETPREPAKSDVKCKALPVKRLASESGPTASRRSSRRRRN